MAAQEQTKRVALKLRPSIIDALNLAAAKDYPAAERTGQVTAGTVIEDLVEKHLAHYIEKRTP